MSRKLALVRLHALIGMTVALAMTAAAGADAQTITPRDAVPAELAAGTLGGAVLGVGGAYVATVACASEAEGWAVLACIGYGVLGYLVGVPVGSAVGVHVAGSAWGVEGNTWLSLLGAVGGEAGGLLSSSGLGALGGEEPPEALQIVSLLGLTPLASSAGATWGFNVGARLSADGVSRLDQD